MVDLILLIILLLALLWGWFKGGVRVLAGLGALIIAYQVARYYSVFWAQPVINMLPEQGSHSKLVDLITMFIDADVLALYAVRVVLFIIIFILTRWLINKLATLITGLFGSSVLGVINRVFGALLGGVIIALAIFYLHGIALPAIGDLGFDVAYTAQDIFEQSRFVLPLVYIVPRIIGL
jgi:uncharacterized membrane protein required for colicin V production